MTSGECGSRFLPLALVAQQQAQQILSRRVTRLLGKHFDLRLSVIPGQGYNVGLPTSPGLQQPVIFEEVHAVATPFEDRIRLGGTMEFGGDHPPFDERRVEMIIASMRKFLDLDWDERFDTWAAHGR